MHKLQESLTKTTTSRRQRPYFFLEPQLTQSDEVNHVIIWRLVMAVSVILEHTDWFTGFN